MDCADFRQLRLAGIDTEPAYFIIEPRDDSSGVGPRCQLARRFTLQLLHIVRATRQAESSIGLDAERVHDHGGLA